MRYEPHGLQFANLCGWMQSVDVAIELDCPRVLVIFDAVYAVVDFFSTASITPSDHVAPTSRAQLVSPPQASAARANSLNVALKVRKPELCLVLDPSVQCSRALVLKFSECDANFSVRLIPDAFACCVMWLPLQARSEFELKMDLQNVEVFVHTLSTGSLIMPGPEHEYHAFFRAFGGGIHYITVSL